MTETTTVSAVRRWRSPSDLAWHWEIILTDHDRAVSDEMPLLLTNLNEAIDAIGAEIRIVRQRQEQEAR